MRKCSVDKKCKMMNKSLTKLLKLAKCAHITLAKKSRKTRKSRKSRKTRRSMKKCVVRRKKSRFGQMPNTLSMMGNVRPLDMSLNQSYTGMSPNQAMKHYEGIPDGLRSNFYTNV